MPNGRWHWYCERARRHRVHRGKDKEQIPVTKLGHLVNDMNIKLLAEIYLFSPPIREFEITDFFLGASLKEEVLKIIPVQKQTYIGQRTWFKAFVAIRDYNGHVNQGIKCSKEVATAIVGLSSWPRSPSSLCGIRPASPTPSLARWLATFALCWCASYQAPVS